MDWIKDDIQIGWILGTEELRIGDFNNYSRVDNILYLTAAFEIRKTIRHMCMEVRLDLSFVVGILADLRVIWEIGLAKASAAWSLGFG